MPIAEKVLWPDLVYIRGSIFPSPQFMKRQFLAQEKLKAKPNRGLFFFIVIVSQPIPGFKLRLVRLQFFWEMPSVRRMDFWAAKVLLILFQCSCCMARLILPFTLGAGRKGQDQAFATMYILPVVPVHCHTLAPHIHTRPLLQFSSHYTIEMFV